MGMEEVNYRHGVWSTDNELSFLKGLGTWHKSSKCTVPRRIALLQGYLDGLRIRERCGLNKSRLRQTARGMIASLTQSRRI